MSDIFVPKISSTHLKIKYFHNSSPHETAWGSGLKTEKGQRHPFSITCHYMFYLIALSCLLSILFMMSSPAASHAFDKKKIQYLDMIKTSNDNISLKFPTDVYTTQNSDIYILDAGLQMILIFDKDLLPVSVIDKTNGLKHPMSIAVDKKGMIYVSEETPGEKHKGWIAVFDPLGRKKKTIKFEGFPGAETFVARVMS